MNSLQFSPELSEQFTALKLKRAAARTHRQGQRPADDANLKLEEYTHQLTQSLSALVREDQERLNKTQEQQNFIAHRLERNGQELATLAARSSEHTQNIDSLQTKFQGYCKKYVELETLQTQLLSSLATEQIRLDLVKKEVEKVFEQQGALNHQGHRQENELHEIAKAISREEQKLQAYHSEIQEIERGIHKLNQQHCKISAQLEAQQQQINDINDVLNQCVEGLIECQREIAELEREQVLVMKVVGVVVSIAAMAATGGFSSLFSSSAAGAATGATAAASTSFIEAATQQVISMGCSYALDKTIGKISPLMAKIFKGISSAYIAGGMAGSTQELMRSASQTFFLNQMGQLASTIGGEPLGRAARIILSHSGYGFFEAASLKELGKELLVDQVAYRVANTVHNPIGADCIEILVKGAGKILSSSSVKKTKQLVKETSFQLAGKIASSGVKDPLLSRLLQGMVTTGLHNYDAQKEFDRVLRPRHTGISCGDQIEDDEGDGSDEDEKNPVIKVIGNNIMIVSNDKRKNYDIRGKEVLVVNGINTSKEEMIELGTECSKIADNANINLLYNSDNGLSVIYQKMGGRPEIVREGTEYVKTLIKKVGYDGEVLLIGYSGGAQVVDGILRSLSEEVSKGNLTQEERLRVSFVGVAGATRIPKTSTHYSYRGEEISILNESFFPIDKEKKSMGKRGCNIVASKDKILTIQQLSELNFGTPKNRIVVKSIGDNFEDLFGDHPSNNLTYKQVITAIFKKYCRSSNPSAGINLGEGCDTCIGTITTNLSAEHKKEVLQKLQERLNEIDRELQKKPQGREDSHLRFQRNVLNEFINSQAKNML